MSRKGLPRAGQFDKRNIHAGLLWGTRKECKLTDRMAGEIIEKVYESKKVGLAQLKQVRHSLSYAYYLTTGKGGDNYTEVKAQWRSFSLKDLPDVRRPLLPKRIPTPKNLKEAFTKPWTPNHPWNLVTFITGVLSSNDTHVFGLRPNVDIKKVKDSKSHYINANEGYGLTDMVGGRSKLHGPKRGTRPWRVYRACFCKKNHVSPGYVQLDKDGNPTSPLKWNTCCPLAAMEFKNAKQGSQFGVYSKWGKSTQRYGQNVGDVPVFANEWLISQGIEGPFDRNCGRKSLSRWLQLLNVPYREHLHIHGDLEEVWRDHYQSKLLKSGYRVRDQTDNSDLATAALRRLARWFHTGDVPKPTVKQQLKKILDDLS